MVGGAAALAWLLLRTGTRPSRISYPCQQAAFGSAAALFGAPAVAALLRCRRRLLTAMRTRAGIVVAAAAVMLLVVLAAVGTAKRSIEVVMLDPPPDYHPKVFLVNDARGPEPGRFGGIDDLVTLMGLNGLKWHRSDTRSLTAGPDGLIGREDVVLIKVNAQWAQRGGTNTDCVRGVLRRIVEHPDGFVGEIIVADNGQGIGSLHRTQNNAEDHAQSVQQVVDEFAGQGWNVSTMLWDPLVVTAVDEYANGDMTSGYVVSPEPDPQTLIRTSYPKFQSASGTYISYEKGIWSPATQTYDADRLVVINMPVLKTHFIYGITGAVKNHMGVVTSQLGTDSHGSVGRGGMGTILADVRMPDVTILDCIWVLAHPGMGPDAPYNLASRRNQLLASTDPVALDAWATKYIMIPQIVENGYTYDAYRDLQDPDNPDSIFHIYLSRSMNELLAAGIETTNDYNAVDLHVWAGDFDRDGDTDLDDFAEFNRCVGGPGGGAGRDCERADYDGDDDVDLLDFRTLQFSFTGAL